MAASSYILRACKDAYDSQAVPDVIHPSVQEPRQGKTWCGAPQSVAGKGIRIFPVNEVAL